MRPDPLFDDHLPGADAVPVASLGLDVFETGLLAVMRHFMQSFAQPQGQGWQHALAIAAERWGPEEGPCAAFALLRVVQEMRRARVAEFGFANPLCPACRDHATPEEAALVMMLHHMRRNRTGPARLRLAEVTGGLADARLVEAGLMLAARFPAQTPRPALRLVH